MPVNKLLNGVIYSLPEDKDTPDWAEDLVPFLVAIPDAKDHHGDLTGLTDDDHSYVLVDGTKLITGPIGGVTPTSGLNLTTKEYVDNKVIASGQIVDHGSLTGLTHDDHIQYILVDGTRTVTGHQEFLDDITINGSGIIDGSIIGDHLFGDGSGIIGIPSLGCSDTNTVELVYKDLADYSSMSGVINCIPQYEWTTPVKVDDPSIIPLDATLCVEWSPNGEYLAVGRISTTVAGVCLNIYQREDNTFVKLPENNVFPSGEFTGGMRVHDVEFSPNGEYLAVGHQYPYTLSLYRRDGSTFSKLPDPSTLPPWNPDITDEEIIIGDGDSYDVSWSNNGEFLSIAHYGDPTILTYQRKGDTFTKLDDPADHPANSSYAIDWSPDGRFLTIGGTAGDYYMTYSRSGTTFTKLTAPVTYPTNSVQSCSWSPDGNFLVVNDSYDAFTCFGLIIYQRSGTTFTKLADPDIMPGSFCYGSDWSPNGEYLAVACGVSPYINIYKRTGTTFAKQTNPTTLPTGAAYDCAWSPDGRFLAVAHDTTPFITIYETSSSIPDMAMLTLNKIPRSGQ